MICFKEINMKYSLADPPQTLSCRDGAKIESVSGVSQLGAACWNPPGPSVAAVSLCLAEGGM